MFFLDGGAGRAGLRSAAIPSVISGISDSLLHSIGIRASLCDQPNRVNLDPASLSDPGRKMGEKGGAMGIAFSVTWDIKSAAGRTIGERKRRSSAGTSSSAL